MPKIKSLYKKNNKDRKKELSKKHKFYFKCPKDGILDRNDVDVWCNRCDKKKMVYKDGMYLCPQCMSNTPGKFSCRICGSTEVEMLPVKASK